MTLEFRGIAKSYGKTKALDRLDLTVEAGSFTVLCGPPKSGKSVLFRILVGLEAPDAGQILLAGRDIAKSPPAQRPVGYVPQNFALYPHLTVAQNMAYPLTLARFPRDEIAKRVDRTAGILSITHLLAKTPDQLSGGEKQRVAVARGLLKDAEIFVLDDPLVGLDYKLRERLMDELKGLREELRATFLYATSDSLEALSMAQVLAVIDHGRILQCAPPAEVYHNPAVARALDLIGFPHANLLPGKLGGGQLVAGPLRFAAEGSGDVVLGIRPEHVRLGPAGQPARVTLVENLGGEAVVYLDLDGQPLTAAMLLLDNDPPEIDAMVGVSIDPASVLLFDATTGARRDGLQKADAHG
ncbi:ABC transporter ATP-binding protein [Rhodobacter ferrooxidans]|uniref:ABC transporter related protein n=1 Tax=Rhodobacter ferrooxidans TaxID=371731 RepID=C8S151_9RHOB|nr:ABC transporter ATP-binding protein [Rhodobacter sp. SW2]EEW25249.1 ABC transporter related protein [Rhodobacter sp. SW2]